MFILKVITEEAGKELDIIRRFYNLRKMMEENHTCIKKMYLIDEQGEILNEYKRL